ncbi:MAG: EAL domain-containing protein [Aquabacterium sp.]
MTSESSFITPVYEPGTVAASVLLAMFASYVALDLAKRVRTSDLAVARGWLIGGSVTMGVGIWSMHFVGMLAFRLPIMVGYDYLYTALSLLAAIAVSSVALRVASHEELTLPRLGTGAFSMGAGICAMHYIGMHAMALAPGIVWNWGMVAVSAAIAVTASAVALLIFFWLRTRKGAAVIAWQGLAAVAMGVAIAGMHYTGMAAASFEVGVVCLSSSGLGGTTLGLLVGMASLVLLSMTLLTSILDARMQSKANRLAISLQDANQRLQHLAFRDPLTLLPNRLVFEEELTRSVQHAEQHFERIALMFIDLDGFKPVNDSFGHATGDEVLRQVGSRLASLARPGDLIARVGGDEFLMLLIGNPGRDAASEMALRIRDAVCEPFAAEGREVRLSCSIGIVLYPDHGPSSRLLSNADAAMYAAKRAGGSVYRFYEKDMASDAELQIALQHDLRELLHNGGQGLMLYYQPKIHALSRQVSGVEALLRWQHPTRGMISPAVFIPVAERFGLIGQLGQWVIDEACRQTRQWLDEGLRMRVAVNLSVHQLRQADLAERIKEALTRHRIEPALMTFEVTESAAMEDTQGALQMFDLLAALGVKLSIDDFGTGYSSLSYLRKLPARQLKIDRSFVKDLHAESDARAVVAAVVSLSHALGLHVVAEGVETLEQESILLEIGCDEFQGFRYAKPMPAQLLCTWITDERERKDAPVAGFRDSVLTL